MKRITIAASIALLTLLLAAAGLAASGPTRGFGGTTQGRTKIITSTQTQSILAQTEWVPIPGASTTITVPARQQALVVARFTSRGGCANNQQCALRIRVGDTMLEPYGADDCAPGCSARGSDLFLSENQLTNATVEKAYSPLGPGTYPVAVEFACLPTVAGECHNGEDNLYLQGFTFVVQRTRA